MKDLTEGNIHKNFAKIAIPLVLAGLLSQAYNTIDTIIAGKFIGEASLGAIGATSPLLEFMSSLFWGYAAGFGIYIAQLFGAKQYKNLKDDILNCLIAYTSIGLLFGIIMAVFSNEILKLLNVDPIIFEEARKYFIVYGLGVVFITMNNAFVHLFSSFGSGTYQFIMSVLSAVLNIAGNIFSVTVLKLGVMGIAFSSVFAGFVVDVFYFIKLFSDFKKMGVAKEKFEFGFSRLKESLRLAIPTMFQQGVMYLSSMLLSPMVNVLGSDASASYTVSLRIYNINSCVFFSSSKTVSAYIAQCVGARKLDKIKRGIRVGTLQAILFLCPILIFCIVFPKEVCSIFFKSDYTGIGVTYSVSFLRYYMPFIFFNLINNQFHAFYRGIGQMKPLIISTFLGSFVRLLAGWILLKLFGMYGFYAGWALSWVADASYGAIIYFNGKWKRTLAQKLNIQLTFDELESKK